MFDNRVKPLNMDETGGPSLGLSEVSPSSSRAGGGKVIHDSRGNAVWQWGVATGVFAAIKSTELLTMLDNPTLAYPVRRTIRICGWLRRRGSINSRPDSDPSRRSMSAKSKGCALATCNASATFVAIEATSPRFCSDRCNVCKYNVSSSTNSPVAAAFGAGDVMP